MSEINTSKLEYSGASAPANTTKVQEAAFSGAHGGASSRAPAVVLVDTNLQDAVGTSAPSVAPPDGGAGLLGWLSGIYDRIGKVAEAFAGVLNIRSLSSETDSVGVTGTVSVSNMPATQAVSAESLPLPLGAAKESVQAVGNEHLATISSRLPATIGQNAAAASLSVVLARDQSAININSATKEKKTYFSGIAVVPTTLTSGLNYFWLRNTSATKKIKIERIETILAFAGTAAATRSLYAIKKFTGATATTGTVTLVAEPAETGNPASVADIKWAAAGGTLTGATISANRIMQLGHVNQLTANIAYDRNMSDAPLVLGTNEGIVLQSDGAVVAGSTVIISLRWIEE